MDTLDFMTSRFGPPPLLNLNVTPIPGRFGQGFAGLIYLSTLNYVDERRSVDLGPFFNEVLQSHEIAHQWWGNSVTAARAEDDWMMEALANYSALLYLEKRRGAKALDQVLDTFRERLLKTNDKGETVESAGPIVWGFRLQSSQAPGAWQAITYEKGAWIFHMLRRRMGDPAFTKLLAELEKRFHLTPVSTEDVERLAIELMGEGGKKALGPFFESWVYGTGVPSLQMTQSSKGLVLTGTVKQTDADEDFSIDVPVEIQLRNGKTMTHWVRTSSEPVDFTVKLPALAAKVTLDPGRSVLRR
jgi:aminopeptidase N